MVGNISIRVGGVEDALAASRNLGPGRWLTAGLCLAAGIGCATLIGWQNTAKSMPAQIVALSEKGATGVVAPAEAVSQIQRFALSPSALLKTSVDLNLAESGILDDRHAEDFLSAAIHVAPSERASVVDINVDTGTPAFDALIANSIARNLTSQQPEASTASDQSIRFSLASKAHVIPAASVLLYQIEAVILSLLMAASVIALGVARKLRGASQPVEFPVKPAPVVPRGILEQIDMLERMWPETGRQNAMPEGSNDEPEQVELIPARNIVVRMAELRQEARAAIEEPSEEALEDVLTDMQSLRDQVRWITAEQLRRRRRVHAVG